MDITTMQEGPVKTVLKDLSLSVEWHDLREVNLANSEWRGIIGHKRREDPLRLVIPLPLHTSSLTPSALKSIFAGLSSLAYSDLPESIPPFVPSIEELQAKMGRKADGSGNQDNQGEEETKGKKGVEESREIDKDMIYMAITNPDSTVVYYKLTKGIKKPADIPDE